MIVYADNATAKIGCESGKNLFFIDSFFQNPASFRLLYSIKFSEDRRGSLLI